MKSSTIVIVGAGSAGLAAAYTVCKHSNVSRVVLVEASDRVGGHAWTVTTPGGEEVDMGFMVLNDVTYPNMLRVYREIGAEVEKSDMSLSVHNGEDFSWSFQENLPWMFRSVVDPKMWKLVWNYKKFTKKAITVLSSPEKFKNLTVGEFCKGLDETMVNKWILPFVSAVWSVGYGTANNFAAVPFLRFMHNHRFLGLSPLKWKTPKGRSQSYVKKIIAACGEKLTVKKNCVATRVDYEQNILHVNNKGKKESIEYGKLILCCSAPIQANFNPPAKAWLSKFQVCTSKVCGHIAAENMPSDRRDWCSWNVRSDDVGEHKAAVTYWVSRIQNLKDKSVFVTVNPPRKPDGCFFEKDLSHPVMDMNSEQAQAEAYKYQGVNDVYYCGAWLRHGFHEDGFHTGIHAAKLALGDRCGQPGARVQLEFPIATKIMPPLPIKGKTYHVRYSPETRNFSYPLYVFRFDTRCPPVGYHREDHFGDQNKSLDFCVREQICQRLGFWPAGKIECVCNLRILGYCLTQ